MVVADATRITVDQSTSQQRKSPHFAGFFLRSIRGVSVPDLATCQQGTDHAQLRLELGFVFGA